MRPKLAASILIYDLNHATPRFLMGKRTASAIFLPNYHVFPGGKLERHDMCKARTKPNLLSKVCQQHIMSGLNKVHQTPHRANALALCGLREVQEETGYVANSDELNLQFIARAITPPNSVKRYDTHFFTANVNAFSCLGTTIDNELSEIDWVEQSQFETLQVHYITRYILEIALDRLKLQKNQKPFPEPITIKPLKAPQ